MLMAFITNAQTPPAELQEQVLDTIAIKQHSNMVSASTILRNNYTTHEALSPREFRNNFREKYNTSEFDYTATKPRESVWDKIKRAIKKILEPIFGTLNPEIFRDYTSIAVKVFSTLIVGFILYFLIRFLISKEGRLWFSKKNEKLHLPAEGLDEDIHEINFPQRIADFEMKGDYRSAVRYRFLAVLKKLSDSQKIQWDVQKTNQDYIAEINLDPIRNDFKLLVTIFDYVWYGEIEVGVKKYEEFKQKFESFKEV